MLLQLSHQFNPEIVVNIHGAINPQEFVKVLFSKELPNKLLPLIEVETTYFTNDISVAKIHVLKDSQIQHIKTLLRQIKTNENKHLVQEILGEL